MMDFISPRRVASLLLVLLLAKTPAVVSHKYSTRGGGGDATQNAADTTTTTSNNNSNMNGDYVIASTPGANHTQQLFPTQYRDYPDLATESFDVYSPLISQLYSQVFWKGLPPVPLPKHIVNKYHNKGMAVVGFEIDQVMIDTSNGVEFSLPINAVYNHHFESAMIGGQEARFELASPQDPRVIAHTSKRMDSGGGGHGIPPHQPYWLVVGGDEASATGLPTQQSFGGANGGEARQSFHGYAPGFAQLIESPREFQITAMQIDTWHREKMSLRDGTKFVAGPLPRNSKANMRNATYSGLLECPVTTRITKHLPPQGYFPLAGGQCSKDGRISTSDDCYKAVVAMVRESDATSQILQASGSDPNRTPGCGMRAMNAPIDNNDSGKRVERAIEAYYNTFGSEEASHTSTTTSSVDCGASSTNPTRLFSATATSLVNVSVVLDEANDFVTIELTGPADVWWGVGFGAHTMANKPWTIVVSGDTVTEHKLANHAAGSVLTPPSIHVKSMHVDSSSNQRTVTLTRSIHGPYFSFKTSNVTAIPFINAVGSSQDFSYHQNKEASSLLLLPVATDDISDASAMCICQQDPPPFGYTKGGVLEYKPVQGQAGERGVAGKVPFNNKCEPYPRTDLLEQKNPTCDIRTYTNGQTACHHMWSLLDADQEIPWPDQPIEYKLKFRFWVQTYDASYHTNVHNTKWGIASPTEYDVPKCAEGVPGCSKLVDEATGQERWVHTIRGTFQNDKVGKLVAAHFHCHAPTCLKTALYLCDEGSDDQGCDETTGKLLCQEDAVRKHGAAGERFNEPGFIYQPPCLWGSPSVGLEPPVNVRGRTLFAIKTADATDGHGGEMAWLQMYHV